MCTSTVVGSARDLGVFDSLWCMKRKKPMFELAWTRWRSLDSLFQNSIYELGSFCWLDATYDKILFSQGFQLFFFFSGDNLEIIRVYIDHLQWISLFFHMGQQEEN